jgi:hypothetical protein
VGYVKKNALGGLAFEDDTHLDQHLLRWMRDIADLRVHGTTFERPIDRFLLTERASLRAPGNHPGYLRTRLLTRRVSTDARVDVDTNHYTVPAQFVGEAVDVVVEVDRLQIQWQDRIIAEHSVHPGRHQVVEDPGHALSFRDGQAKLGKPCEIQRDLSEYAKAAGGEPW